MEPSDPLSAYFSGLDAGDAESCAALLAADVVFLRQSLGPGGELLPGLDVLHGRVAVRDYVRDRGVRPYRHVIRSAFGDPVARCVEGVVRTTDGLATSVFVATADLDADGLISRWFAVGTPVTDDDLPDELADELADELTGGSGDGFG